MTKKIDFPERRKHEVGQIKDVSKGGLAFQHLVITESTEEPFEVEILSEFDDFRLEKLPVRAVVDFELDTMGLYALFSIRQLSLQFRRLNHSQKLLLDHFIQRYTHK
jgi:hypothetical protein